MLSSIQKVTKTGRSALIINIPKNVYEIMGIKGGDLVNVQWIEKFEKNSEKTIKKEEKKKGGILPEI